ncbi:NTP/NDP exchange transporter [Marinobacter caseinilyticus]|uniref:NTP/NDP exchange transporter n=1 Tax=Marinobacter caseinilyticus TaxID=2692195 RepID=UPI00140DBD4B|nr:MFS transporter [Marinobacter caseinilyticus]
MINRDEWPALLASFGYFFFLLFSYYILRPVRDEMGVRGGVDNLQWLFSATFIAMLVASPLFAALAIRFRRAVLLPLTYGLFIACIIGFWFWLQADIAAAWAARVFFVWLSVFNLFVVSVFWSFMTDIFNDRQAARLFGIIAAGGSAGAIVGPGLTGMLAQLMAPQHLLPIAALALALTLPCIWIIQRNRAAEPGHTQTASQQGEALGGTLLEGAQAIARSRYLQGICAFILLYTTLATFLYFAQAEIVSKAFSDSGDRTSVFAALDFATNTLTIGLQLLITARLIQRFGLNRTLALVPVIVAIGFVCLAAAPVLITLVVFQCLRRAGNYAIAKPGREMLFTVVPRMEKYKAKNIIDTVIYRGGDAVAGWAYTGLAALGLGLTGISWVAVPLAALWAVIGYRLGQGHSQRARQEHKEITNDTPQTQPLR